MPADVLSPMLWLNAFQIALTAVAGVLCASMHNDSPAVAQRRAFLLLLTGAAIALLGTDERYSTPRTG